MRRLATLTLLALAALPTLARRVDDPEPPPLVAGTALWADPGAWLGTEVRFVVQHEAWLESWNPMATRFGAGDYRAWSAWADEQQLWRAEDYDAPAVRLFVRRGGASEWALTGLEPYQRFEVVGHVKAVLAGQPWVEVVGVRPLSEQIGDGSLVHATRALEAQDRGEWERAEEEFGRALAAPLPPLAHDELQRLRQYCHDQRRQPTFEERARRR